jgi:DNA-binding HxlR family transcriptional regulator
MSKKTECPRSGCPIVNAVDVLGDRWTLVLIRDLMLFDRHEFGEFRDSGEGIATNILTTRLKTLAESGIIDSIPHPTNGTKKLYYLTDRGKSLLPLMREVILWGDAQCEGSQAPPAAIKPIRQNGKAFIAGTLKRLKEWELANLPAE